MNPARLPAPDPAAQAASEELTRLIAAEIAAQGGSIPFSRFMELALYAPRLGYYANGSQKIGAGGDFITAPALTPLFGQTLARQLAALLPHTAGHVYEFGAGTGQLAAQLLTALSGSLNTYHIIELSPDLAQRQQEHIAEFAPAMLERVVWLNALPEQFDGILIGNEVLDAMPVERIRRHPNGTFGRIAVSFGENGFEETEQPLTDPDLIQAAADYFPATDQTYTGELHPAQHAFIRTLAAKLTRGAMIWLDYGFDAAQYYHPQRRDGTLIGHYRHHTVHNPFERIGLTDLTCHVNFTAVAEAGCGSGLDLIGYTTQAAFLLNLGLTRLLAEQGDSSSPGYIRAAAACQTLIAPQEMGELFKVIAFGRNIDPDWAGFAAGDLCHRL